MPSSARAAARGIARIVKKAVDRTAKDIADSRGSKARATCMKKGPAQGRALPRLHPEGGLAVRRRTMHPAHLAALLARHLSVSVGVSHVEMLDRGVGRFLQRDSAV